MTDPFQPGVTGIADTQFTGQHDLSFTDSGQKINVAGVPLGVEVVKTRPFRTLTAVKSCRAVESAPVIAVTSSGRKEICTLIIFPRLKVNTQFIIVFAVDFVNCDLQTDLRNGYIVTLEHTGNIFCRIIFHIKYQPVQIRIVCHQILALPHS